MKPGREHGWVNVRHNGDPGTSTGVDAIIQSHADEGAGAASAASAVLNSVQNCISEELREPWPSLGLPEVVLEGSRLRMSFGGNRRWRSGTST
jgi:hypothetical protein